MDPIAAAAELLKKGELVAFPTETVYGLGAPIFNPEAIAKIYAAKGRPSDNPLIAHISSLDQINQIAIDIPEEFYLLAKVFFPGPLTVVLKKHPNVPSIVSGGLDTIAVRMSSHPIAQALIKAVGQPLVAPSANLSGKPSSTTAEHVRHDFPGITVIDGGKTEYGIESTVVSLISFALLRPGAIPKEAIEKIVPLKEASDDFSSPGMRYRHYAPKARVKLITEETSEKGIKAEDLYAILRKADEDNFEEIVIYCTPEMLQDAALMDRLKKAASR